MRTSKLSSMHAFIGVLSCAGALAKAQSYPVKPVRILFGFTAGGAGDVSARILAQKLSESLSQNVFVENRAGAGGAIADEAVARSPVDGYTLLYAAGSSAILLETQTGTPEQFAAFIRSERAQNAKPVKFAGINVE